MMNALDEAIKEGSSLGCPEVESFVSSVRIKQVSAEHNMCNSGRTSQEYGLFVRAGVGKRIGMSFTNSLASRDVRDCTRSAARLAKLRPEDKSWKGFPSPGRRSIAAIGQRDSSVANMEMADLVGLCEDMIEASLGVHKSVNVSSAGVEMRENARGVVSTSGVRAFGVDTTLSTYCYCVSGRGTSVTPECWEGGASRKSDIDFRSLGRSAAEIAMLSSKRVRPCAGRFDIVFSPFALGMSDGGFMRSVLSSALSGESVVRGKSFLAGRAGASISSDTLSIRDNPRAPGRSGSRPFDDEGMPTERTELIDSGVLRGFLWDSSSASLAGARSTGNARRDLLSGELTVKPNNLEVVPERLSWRELCEDIRRGYLVWSCQGGHTSNIETGRYSFVANPGMLVEDGEIVGGVRGAMVSGNVLELLRGTDVVGGDVRDLDGCLMPSIRFRDVRVDTG